MASTSQTTNPKCGFCNKVLHDNELKSSNKFEQQCTVCNVQSQLHSTCAKKLYNASATPAGLKSLKKNETLSLEMFTAMPLNFYCKECKETCFYCNGNHQCKLQMFIILLIYCQASYIIIFDFIKPTKRMLTTMLVLHVIKSGVMFCLHVTKRI